MRGLLLSIEMLALLPVAVLRPFVGLLLWSWISFMNPHRLVWGFATDLPWAAAIFCVTVLGMLVARDPPRIRLDTTDTLVILFLVLISFTTLFALGPADQVQNKWATVFKAFLFLLTTKALLTDRLRVHALIWVMVISLGFYGIKGGLFALWHGGFYRVNGPPATTIEDNNALALGLLVTLPLMNYLRLQSAVRMTRVCLAITMGLTLLAVLASYSRGALIGLAAFTLVLWMRSSRKLLGAVVMGVALAGAISFMPPAWMDRMNSISKYEGDESAQGRIAIWGAAIEMAIERPLTGAGFYGPYSQQVVDQFAPGTQARSVHSIYLEVLGEHGFPTFVIWLGITVVGLLNASAILRMAHDSPRLSWAADLARMTQVAVVPYLVSGTFLPMCYWDFYFTLLMALAATRRIIAEDVRQTLPQRSLLHGARRSALATVRAPATPRIGSRVPASTASD